MQSIIKRRILYVVVSNCIIMIRIYDNEWPKSINFTKPHPNNKEWCVSRVSRVYRTWDGMNKTNPYELTFKAWFCAELISWTARLGLRNYFSTFLVSFPFHYWDGNQNGLNEAISHSSWKARKQLQSQNLLLGQVLFGREIGIINLQTPRNMELTKKIPILKKKVIFSKVAKILDIT